MTQTPNTQSQYLDSWLEGEEVTFPSGKKARIIGVDPLSTVQEDGEIPNFFLEAIDGKEVSTQSPGAKNFSALMGNSLTMWESVANWLADIWRIAEPHLAALGRWFLNDALPAMMSFISDTVLPALNDFQRFLIALWDDVSPHLTNLLDWFLTSALPKMIDIVRDQVIPMLEDFIGFLSDLWEIAAPHLKQLADWFLTSALPQIQTFISETVIPAISDLIGWLGDMWGLVKPHLMNLVDWFFNSGLQSIIDFITQDVKPVIDELIGLLGDIWNLVKKPLGNLFNWFFTDGLQAIIDFINSDLVQVPLTTLRNLISGIFNMAADALSKVRELIGAQDNLANDVADGNIGIAPDMGGSLMGQMSPGAMNRQMHEMAASLATGKRVRSETNSRQMAAASGTQVKQTTHREGDVRIDSIHITVQGEGGYEAGRNIGRGLKDELGLKERMKRKGHH